MSAHADAHAVEIRNPGPYRVSGGLKTLFLVFAVVGLVALVAGFFVDAKRVWPIFLVNHFYFLALALGGIFFAALQWLTGAMWSATVRRIGEAYTAYLPVAFVSMVVLFFGAHTLYHWTHADAVAGDAILQGKAAYLNMPFFVIRSVAIFGLWIFFAKKMIGNSIAQDWTKDYAYTVRNKRMAPAFLILFALTFTMMSFDLLMSLDPHWFSTMFGVYAFAGLFYSTLALTAILAVLLKRKGALEGIMNENHLHDVGKFMFAFTVFWAYIGFSQFMLIWYANLPEEVGYYVRRFTPGWYWVSVFLLVGKFILPFLILLPRDAKRNETLLLWVGAWMLFCQFVDVLWMVQPEFFDAPRFSWIEGGVTLGFIGVFGLVVSRFLGRNNVVAIGDPRLAESVLHHHQ